MGKYGNSVPYIFQPGEMRIRQRYPAPGWKPTYRLLRTEEDYQEAMQDLDEVLSVSFDTETTSLYIDELTLVSFSFKYGHKVWDVLVNHEREDLCFTDYNKLRALVWKILTRERPYLFNARYDLNVVRKELSINTDSLRPVDVQSLIFISDTNWKMPGLKECTRFFLGFMPPEFEEQWRGPALQHVDPDVLCLYMAYDADDTYELGEMFYNEVNSRYGLILTLDRRLIPALMHFEESEFNVDRRVLLGIQEDLKLRLAELQEAIYTSVGPFLITSAKQLGAKLISLGYDTGVRTKTNQMSVAIDALLNLEGVEFVKQIVEYKKLMKLNSAYIQPFLRRNDLGLPYRFHYVLNNAPTMRLAAAAYAKSKKKAEQQLHHFVDMNFQSISKPVAVNRRVNWNPATLEISFQDDGQYLVESGSPKLNLRKAFVPPSDEFIYCAIDFAGQELRIAANLSGEPVWINAFKNGEDIHKATAIAIWGAENYDKNKRKKAKIANFAILYGGGVFTLMTKLKMSEQEATEFYNNYRAALPRLFAWAEEIHMIARQQGYVISPYRLPRRLSFYYRQGGSVARFADRSAVNTLIQGSAGVIIRLALTRLFELVRPGGKYHGDVLFRGTIHDELDFCIRKSRFYEAIADIVPLMTDTVPKSWVVPMEVEVSVGANWGEMVAVDHTKAGFPPKEVEDTHVAEQPVELDPEVEFGFDDGEEYVDEEAYAIA